MEAFQLFPRKRNGICVALLSSGFPESIILKTTLAAAGIDCEELTTGGRLLECGGYEIFDILIIRKTLDDMEGINLVRRIKDLSKRDVPILFWSDKDDEDELVEVLYSGADDYVRPPFRAREILARILAICRRTANKSMDRRISVGHYELNRSQKRIFFGGQEIPLSPRDFEVAWLFFSNEGKTLASKDLELLVWGKELPKSSRALSVLITRLRCALGITEDGEVQILSIYGSGYCLVKNTDVLHGNQQSIVTASL